MAIFLQQRAIPAALDIREGGGSWVTLTLVVVHGLAARQPAFEEAFEWEPSPTVSRLSERDGRRHEKKPGRV